MCDIKAQIIRNSNFGSIWKTHEKLSLINSPSGTTSLKNQFSNPLGSEDPGAARQLSGVVLLSSAPSRISVCSLCVSGTIYASRTFIVIIQRAYVS